MPRKNKKNRGKKENSASPSSSNIQQKQIPQIVTMNKPIFNKNKQNNRMNRCLKSIMVEVNRSSNKRHASSISINSSLENTVIENKTLTPELIPNPVSPQVNTVTNLVNSKEPNNSLIVINDDDDLIINNEPCKRPKIKSPFQCSTPISNKKRKNLNITATSNILAPKSNNNSVLAQNFNEDVINLTRQINRDSFLTIDLTTESGNTSMSQCTVIDVDSSDMQDCSVTNSSNYSMSGDSDVTVIQSRRKKNKLNPTQMRKFANGIANLNASQRGKLLEFITQKIFNSNGTDNVHTSAQSIKRRNNRATETIEHTYIKEVILGQCPSRNSVGSNIFNPERDQNNKTGLRMIVIDGSNVAMQHCKGRRFSVKGLNICIDYFLSRGHVVKAFVPHFRCKFGKSSDPRLLDNLERRGLVVYTPSREVQGKMIASYDDRYIVQCAAEFDAIIVSGDNYRDLQQENPRWKFVIENRLLPFTWVGDMIMFPRDPLGRNGPTLEQFLKHPEPIEVIPVDTDQKVNTNINPN